MSELYRTYNLEHRSLSPKEIQDVINLYIAKIEELKKENVKLKQIINSLMQENKTLREFRKWYQDRFDSD